MDDVKIVETIDRDKVPLSRGRKQLNYQPILKSVATLRENECLVLEIDMNKYHRVTGIRNAIKIHFPSAKYTVTSRTDKKTGKTNIYIHK